MPPQLRDSTGTTSCIAARTKVPYRSRESDSQSSTVVFEHNSSGIKSSRLKSGAGFSKYVSLAEQS